MATAPKPLPKPPTLNTDPGKGATAKPLPVPGAPPAQKKPKPRSTLRQFFDVGKMIALLPQTVPMHAAKGVYHAGQFGWDYLGPNAKDDIGTNEEWQAKYFPEYSAINTSVQGYAKRVANVAPIPRSTGELTGTDVGMHLPTGWKENSAYYQKAIDEGRIVDVGFEDIGNTALAAQGVGGLLGEAGRFSAPLSASERAGVLGTEDAALSGAAQRASAWADTRAGVGRTFAVDSSGGASALPAVERLQPVWVPGRGLAGALEGGRVGPSKFLPENAGAAERVSALGDKARGFSAANDTMARPFKAAGDLVEAGGNKLGVDISKFRPSNFVPAGASTAVNYLAENTELGRKALPRVTTAGRQLTRQLSGVIDQYRADSSTATRMSLDPAVLAKYHFGLTAEQASAAMSVDQLFHPITEMVRNNAEGEAWRAGRKTEFDFDTVINGMYSGKGTKGQRPTADLIRTIMDYEDGKLDAGVMAAMDTVAQAQRNVAERRSVRSRDDSQFVAGDEVQVGTVQPIRDEQGIVTNPTEVGNPIYSTQYARDKNAQPTAPGNEDVAVSPENFGNVRRPSVILQNQAKLQQVASKADRTAKELETIAAHDARVYRAMQAVTDRLPDPPNVQTERAFGKYTERDAVLRREHARAQNEVERAVDEYVKLSEAETPPAAFVEARRRLDKANDREAAIREQIERTARRQEAAAGLSRASGEFKPGARRTLDENGEVVNVDENLRRPEADTAGMPSAKEVRGKVEERRVEQVQNIRDQLDRMSPEGRQFNSNYGMLGKGAEHDFWETIPVNVRRRLNKERWFFKSEDNLPVDNLQSSLRNAGIDTPSAADAASVYIDKIKELWDAQDAGGERYIPDIAAELGLPENVVAASINPRLSNYAGLLASEPASLMEGLRSDFLALDGPEADIVEMMLSESVKTEGMTPSDFATLLADNLPGTSQRDIETMLVDNNVDMRQLTDWIVNGDMTASLRAITDTRTPGQNMQLGRYAGELAGLKIAHRGAMADQAAGVKSLVKAMDQGVKAEAHAEATIAKATGREEWLAGRRAQTQAKIPTAVSDVENPWRRYQSADGELHKSAAERETERLGASRERAARSERDARNARRAADRAQWKVGQVPTELGRDFQVRLVEDVNGPAITRARSSVKRGNFGTVKGLEMPVPGKVAKDPYLTGDVGTLASKYGVYNETIDNVFATMSSKANNLDLEMTDRATWTHPDVVLEPLELANAFHEAMATNGKVLQDWEKQTFNDSTHSAQLQLKIDQLAESHGVTRQERAPIPATAVPSMYGPATNVPGSTGYKPRSGGQMWAGEGGKAMQLPFAVHELINDYRSEWNMPEDVIIAAEKAKRSYLDTRDRFLERKMDEHARAIPAPYRGIHQVAKMQVAELLDQATKLNEAKPGTGDVYAEMAWDVSSGLDQMVQKGLNPQHLIGGAEVNPTGTGAGRLSGIGNRRAARATKLKGTGLRELNIDAYARLEARELENWLLRRRDHVVGQAFARKVSEVPEVHDQVLAAQAEGRELTGTDIRRIAQEEGWVPLDPRQGVSVDSDLIPKRIQGAMETDNWFDQSSNPVAVTLRGVAAGNRMWKTWLLGLSPKWVMGNVLGMTLAATVHGGIGPVEFFEQMARNVRAQGGVRATVRNEGLLPELPGQLSTSGLTRNEFEIAFNRKAKEMSRGTYSPMRAVDKYTSAMYAGNEVFDNLAKSTVYLSKLRRGEERASALKSTLDAMGNYNAMSTFERRVVREIIPFYAWMRQSSKVMLRLPYQSPMRAAMVYSIGTALTDPDITPEVMAMIGSRFRIGGPGSTSFFDMGSFNPSADFTEQGLTAFDPRNIGRALTPTFRLPFQFLTGGDPNTWGQETRPTDTYDRELWGAKDATPAWSNLLHGDLAGFAKETLWMGSRLTPQTRGLSELAYGDEARYAGTGYPIASLPRNKNISQWRSLARILQAPAPYYLDPAEITAAAAKRAKAGK